MSILSFYSTSQVYTHLNIVSHISLMCYRRLVLSPLPLWCCLCRSLLSRRWRRCSRWCWSLLLLSANDKDGANINSPPWCKLWSLSIELEGESDNLDWVDWGDDRAEEVRRRCCPCCGDSFSFSSSSLLDDDVVGKKNVGMNHGLLEPCALSFSLFPRVPLVVSLPSSWLLLPNPRSESISSSEDKVNDTKSSSPTPPSPSSTTTATGRAVAISDWHNGQAFLRVIHSRKQSTWKTCAHWGRTPTCSPSSIVVRQIVHSNVSSSSSSS